MYHMLGRVWRAVGADRLKLRGNPIKKYYVEDIWRCNSCDLLYHVVCIDQGLRDLTWEMEGETSKSEE